MTEVIALNPNAAVGNGQANLLVYVHWGSSANVVTGGAAVPPVLSRGQAYYWTRTWQDFERASEQALAVGDFAEFDNPADAVHWLLDADEG
jgi:hypothetical protein